MNPYIQYMYSYPHKTAYRPMTGVNLKDYAGRLAGPGHGLYLHIPFCQSKCGYCNLFSVTGAKTEEMEGYLDAVERQLEQYGRVLQEAGTVFSDFTIGGGTPLLLTEGQLERVHRMTGWYLNFDRQRTMVIETAPNQTDRTKLRLLKDMGVTRVSMGIQSFAEAELKTLRRGHSAKKAREALELLMSFEFPCVNADFIYGIPGQSVESLLESLKEAVSFGPEEIFLYPLYVKHGAGLEKELGEGMVLEPEKAFLQYREAAGFLKAEGFRQDSMRRFVRGGGRRQFSECGFGMSLALGCGGRSYVGNLHFCTPYAITRQSCLKELRNFENTDDFSDITHGILLSREEEKRRYVIRHILIRPGLDANRYKACFGTEVLDDFPLLSRWLDDGFLVWDGKEAAKDQEWMKGNALTPLFLTLTEEGLGLSDYLGPQLISRQVQERMAVWEAEHGKADGSLPGKFKKL